MEKIEFQLPLAGKDDRWARSSQPEATTPDALNVLPFDAFERARLAQRPGTRSLFASPIGNPAVDRLFRPARRCSDDALSVHHVPIADIAAYPFGFRYAGDNACYYVSDSDPPVPGAANVIPASQRNATVDCDDCESGGGGSFDDFRQARRCFDDTLVNLWVPDNDISVFPYFFKWDGDGRCYRVEGTDPASKTPGPLASNRTVQTNCQDNDCGSGSNPPVYQRAQSCAGVLANIWLNMESIDGNYPFEFFTDGKCYVIFADSERSRNPGHVPHVWQKLSTSCAQDNLCQSTTPPPECDNPPCPTVVCPECDDGATPIPAGCPSVPECDPGCEPGDPNCNPDPPVDPPPDPPVDPPDPPCPDPTDPTCNEPPQPMYLPLFGCQDHAESGLYVAVGSGVGSGTVVKFEGDDNCYYAGGQATPNPGTEAVNYSVVASCDAPECGMYEALKCGSDEPSGLLVRGSDIGGLPFFFKSNDRCYYVPEGAEMADGGTPIDNAEAIDDCDDPDCFACYYKWTQTYSCTTATWGSVTQAARSCARENPYEGNTGVWERISASESGCTYQYVSRGDSCEDDPDCDWPASPTAQTAEPDDCCWLCCQDGDCCFSNKSTAQVSIEYYFCDSVPAGSCANNFSTMGGVKYAATLNYSSCGAWSATGVSTREKATGLGCPNWASPTNKTQSISYSGSGTWVVGGFSFTGGDCCGIHIDDTVCVEGPFYDMKYFRKVSVTIENNKCCKAGSVCLQAAGNCDGTCNTPPP